MIKNDVERTKKAVKDLVRINSTGATEFAVTIGYMLDKYQDQEDHRIIKAKRFYNEYFIEK